MGNPSKKPVIGITMGDPAGIGPEIILAMLGREPDTGDFRVVVIGSRPALDATARALNLKNPCTPISEPAQIKAAGPGPLLLDLDNIQLSEYTVGAISARTGRASVEYVLRALDLALEGRIDAMVTAPIHKEAMHLAGHAFPGHTELLAEKTGTTRYAMMLIGGPLRVVLATTHLPLREVPNRLTPEGIADKILLADRAVRDLGFASPRIAVAGLNPHAGEAGIFGTEERGIIAPAVARAAAQGVDVQGPLPADTLFYRAYHGEFHALVCMYHDQGLVPLKMIALDSGVNVTLGLPIIRTSVDHGTALDIAGKGVANPGSLMAAVRTAARLAKTRER